MRPSQAFVRTMALASGLCPGLSWAQADAQPATGVNPPTGSYEPGAQPTGSYDPYVRDTVSNLDEATASEAGRISGFMGWTFNVPLGSARDFTAVVSPLGFELQFNAWLLDNLSVGVSGEWATYVDNRPRTTFSVDRTAVTATAYNYMQTTTARLLLHYCFDGGGAVRPYIGPHVGVTWSSFDLQAADLSLSDNEVSVAVGGEAGMEIPLGRYAPVALVNLRYSFAPEAEFRNLVTNVQSISMMLGVGF
jgi:hypothetical protein